MLYLVGVPIGNYEDITLRAISTLKSVDVIACEDTRNTKKLLDHLDIKDKKLIAHHEHNEQTSAQGIISLIQQGQSLAFVSDSGMPAISDPGFVLLKQAAQANIQVQIIPGVSASITALAGSGLSPARFHFEGFLPRKTGDRKKRLEQLKHLESTLVFYESPHRILESIADMVTVFGNRKAALCRELTKEYEEINRDSLQNIYDDYAARDKILGEMVLVVEAGEAQTLSDEDLENEIKKRLQAGQSAKDIRNELAELFGLKKSDVYQRIISLQKT